MPLMSYVFSKMNAGIIAWLVPLSEQPTMDWDIWKHFFPIWIDLQFDLCTIQPAFSNPFNLTTSFTRFNGIFFSFYPFEWIFALIFAWSKTTHNWCLKSFSTRFNRIIFISSSLPPLNSFASSLSPLGMNWLFIKENEKKKELSAQLNEIPQAATNELQIMPNCKSCAQKYCSQVKL